MLAGYTRCFYVYVMGGEALASAQNANGGTFFVAHIAYAVKSKRIDSIVGAFCALAAVFRIGAGAGHVAGVEVIMKTSSSSLIGLGILPAVIITLFGCGGGGGSASPGAAAKGTFNSKTRLIQVTRVSRTLLAITGLGRTITRAATPLAQASFSISARQRPDHLPY